MGPERKRPGVSFRVDTFNALSEPNYRLLWLGTLTTQVGRSMRVFIRGYLVYEITGSAVWLGAVSAALAFPQLFLPFAGGVLADRMDRRRLLITTESLLVVLWFVTSMVIVARMPYLEWYLAFAAVLSGTIQSFGRPARQALIPNVVSSQNLMNAIALDATVQRLSTIIAPTLGGLVVAVIGAGGGFFVTTALQFMTVFLLFMMNWEKQVPMQTRQTPLNSLMEGFDYVRRDAVIVGIVAVGAAAALFGAGYGAFMPKFAKDVLNVGPQGLGLLLTANGIGGVVGGLVMASMGNFKHKGALQLAAGLSKSVFLIMFAQSRWFPLCFILLMPVSLTTLAFQTVNDTILQLVAPEHLRGRILATRFFLHGLAAFGLLPLGLIAEAYGVPFSITLGATLFAIALVLVSLFLPAVRRYRSDITPQVGAGGD